MRRGEIFPDGEAPPKLLFLLEGLIAHAPETKRRRVLADPQQWSVDGRMVAHMWDLHWRTKYGFDVVTLEGEKFANAMEERFKRDHLPYGEFVFAPTVAAMLDAVVGGAKYRFLIHSDRTLVEDLGPWDGYVQSPDLFDIRFGGN